MQHNVLMCRPDYFGVDYSINPWMSHSIGNVDHAKSIKQWEKLYEAISSVATVKLLEPQRKNPDMVFTANGGMVCKEVAYLPRFKHKERRAEEKFFEKWFEKNGYLIVKQHVTEFEGEGDCLRDFSGQYWMGHGFRSSKKYEKFLNIFGVHPHTLKLIDSRFYHLDTCFLPLEEGIMYYPKAFSRKSIFKIGLTYLDENVFEVSEEEALTFCCNAVIIKREVFMPKCESVAKRLKNLGYKVHQFDMSEFIKSGGACKCLVLHLNDNDS